MHATVSRFAGAEARPKSSHRPRYPKKMRFRCPTSKKGPVLKPSYLLEDLLIIR